MPSATTTEDHIPSMPNNKGNNMTAPHSNTNVREKEIPAETSPLFKAVKKAEAYTLNPAKRKDNEKIMKARRVNKKSS